MDAVIDEQVGRRIRIGDQWLTDWASCNYLGFDLDEEIIASVPEYLAKWGTHPSWSRLLGNPRMYPEIEEQLTELLGCEDTPAAAHDHAHPHVGHPGPGGRRHVFLDGRAHKTDLRRRHGRRGPRRQDRPLPPQRLRAPRGAPARERPGRPAADRDGRRELDDRQRARHRRVRPHRARARLPALRRRRPRLRRDRRACRPTSRATTASRATASCATRASTTRTSSWSPGFSKSYSSLLAFLALPTRLKDALKVLAPPYLYSGPSPVASLATTLAGLAGQPDARRRDPRRPVARRPTASSTALHDLGHPHAEPRRASPSSRCPLAHHEDIDEVGRYLFDHGRLRHAGGLPAGAQARGRLPDPDHRGQHRRGDRRAHRGPRRASTSASSSNQSVSATGLDTSGAGRPPSRTRSARGQVSRADATFSRPQLDR